MKSNLKSKCGIFSVIANHHTERYDVKLREFVTGDDTTVFSTIRRDECGKFVIDKDYLHHTYMVRLHGVTVFQDKDLAECERFVRESEFVTEEEFDRLRFEKEAKEIADVLAAEKVKEDAALAEQAEANTAIAVEEMATAGAGAD